MHRRPAVLVVALVVLAGCGAVPFGDESPETPRETLTPAPVPETDQQQTSTSVDRPPGLRGGRIDADRLRAAHESFLAGQSYTWDLDFDVQESEQPESMFEQGFQRRVLVEGDRFLVEQIDNGEPLEQSLFVNDSGGYLRVVQDNETERNTVRDPGDIEDYAVGGQLVERFLSGMSPNVTRIQRDGRAYYRLYDESGLPPRLERLGATIENYRVTAYVTPEGFVRSIVVRYDRTWDIAEETVSIRFDYSRVGETTVEAPEWVSGLAVPTPTATPGETTVESESPTGTAVGTTTANGTATATETGTPTSPPTATPASVTG